MPEILAPAGNMESLIAAVRSGADAVYLGLKELSARKNADNFTEEELINATKYCRERGVKVYLAVNTLLKDNEWDKAERAANIAAKAGVDALIVADLGLIRYFSKVLPSIPIHASTQTTVLSPEAARLLERLGVKRIVLGRELSKEEIINIKNAVSCELEIFVHGALCMSVSGQCLFSSYLGGRSGNRGLCAAPCRLPFKSSVSGNNFALSLKDNSLYNKISELSKIGITSLKIEGRMKRAEYVSAAVKSLRDIIEGGEYNKTLLEKTFSREGFTSGYYDGKIDKTLFGKREDTASATEKESYPEIHEFYKNECQRLPLYMKASLSPDKFSLSVSDGKNKVSLSSLLVSPANTKGTTEETIKEKLQKLGGTPFYLKDIEISLEEGLYLPISEINRLKAEAVEKILSLRGERKEIKPLEYEFYSPDKKPQPKKRYAYLNSPEGAEFFDKILTDISKIHLFSPEKTIISLPRYFSPEKGKELRNLLLTAKEKGYNTAAADNLNSLGLLSELGFNIVGTGGLNVLNSESIRLLEELGVSELILSTENSFSAFSQFKSSIPTGAQVFGWTPLMLLRACPITGTRNCEKCPHRGGALTDRKGINFKIRCQGEYSELLNSRPLYAFHKEHLFGGADILYYDLSEEKEINGFINKIKEKSPPTGEWTLGLYDNKLL